jgi:hypothetical protein
MMSEAKSLTEDTSMHLDAGMALSSAVLSNFAIQHLLAANHFSRHVAEVENAHTGKPFGAFFEEILWFSSACVLSCCAGLEAYANELLLDHAKHLPELSPELVAKFWNLIERKPVFDKLDMALLLKKKALLSRDTRPTKDVATIVYLRNSLTHFKPEWDNEQVKHAELSRQLEHRFTPSQFLPAEDPIFPRRWATHGCMQWALKSCVDFLIDLESRANLPPKVGEYASQLRG